MFEIIASFHFLLRYNVEFDAFFLDFWFRNIIVRDGLVIF